MTPYSWSRVIQVYGSPKIPNGFEKTLFSPFICGQACVPTSDRVHANMFCLAATVKIFGLTGENNLFQINLGSQRLGLCLPSWMKPLHVFFVFSPSTELLLLRRMCQHCFAVKFKKSFVDCATPNSPSAWGWEDKAWISIFWRTSFFHDGKSRYTKKWHLRENTALLFYCVSPSEV